MANKTIDQLTAAAAALLTHEYEVYDPAGSPKSQKVTGTQLVALANANKGISVVHYDSLFAFPSGAGTQTFTNSTGHNIILQLAGLFVLTNGNQEQLAAGTPSASGVQSQTGFATVYAPTDGSLGSCLFQIVLFVLAGATFDIYVYDDDGSVGGWSGQVILL